MGTFRSINASSLKLVVQWWKGDHQNNNNNNNIFGLNTSI